MKLRKYVGRMRRPALIVPLVATSALLVAFVSRARLVDGTPYYHGWRQVLLNGQGYSSDNNAPLPDGVTIASVDGEVTVGFSASASSPPAQQKKNSGSAVLEYRVPTSDNAGKTKKFVLKLVRRDDATASASIYQTGASASASGSVGAASARVTATASNPVRVSPQLNLPGYDFNQRVTSTASTNLPRYYGVLVAVSAFTASAMASGGTGGGGRLQELQAAWASATASSTINLGGSKATELDEDAIVRTGSAFRQETWFQTTRSDGVPDRLQVATKNDDGSAVFCGLGYPNLDLTIKLIQPGFLPQTQVRKVLNEQFVMPGTTGPVAPVIIELVYGDANGDGVINSTDTGIIAGYVGTGSSDDAWHDVVPNSALMGGLRPIFVYDLDENLDGAITMADVNVAMANVGRTLP